ncbi:MAG: efflux RND transporter periplasmic adaptor subunit [Flavobacteriales bacterium]|nr:efflux RND transporter periplasmic adaptor subunit [Flavobacteriales bacterium]
MNRKVLIIVVSILLVVILLIVFKGKGGKELKVSVEEAVLKNIVQTVAATGKVQPEIELSISPDVSGEITELYVQEGDTVKEGQILLKIKPDLYISSVDRANAGVSTALTGKKMDMVMLSQAEARLTEATANYNRSKELLEKKVISKAEFEKAESAFLLAKDDVQSAKEKIKAADFNIDNAEANLREAKQNLARTVIYSPTDGIVSKINNKKGERVVGTAQMQGTEIMRISNFNNVEVRVDVNENDILKIHKGDSAVIEVDAYGDRIFKGIVTQIAKASKQSVASMSTDQVTTFEVKIRFLKSTYSDLIRDNSTAFLPGLSANVDIQTERGDNLISLPIECVTTRKKESSDKHADNENMKDEIVFLIRDGKTVKKVVTTGIQNNSYIEIKSGIKLKDKAISGPYDILSTTLEEGRKVKIVERESLYTKKD